MKLGLFGAGGLGAEVADIVRSDPALAERYNEVFFVVTNPESDSAHGLPVVGEAALAETGFQDVVMLNCVGEPLLRKEVFDRLKMQGCTFETLVASAAHVAGSARLNEGVIVYPGCYVGPNTHIGQDSILISNCVVSHDGVIGAHCVLCPLAVVSGACEVGEGCLLGSGCSLKEKTRIGSNSVVGLGAAVFKDVPDNASAIGNPARCTPREEGQRVFS